MNTRDLLLNTIQGYPTKRMPVAPFIFNNYIKEYYGSKQVDVNEKGIEIYKHYGFDIILRTANVWEYLDETFTSGDNWQVTTEKCENSNGYTVTTLIRTPEKTLTQQKRYRNITQYETVEAITEYYIKTTEDFDQFVKYQPQVPVYDCSEIKRAKKLIGENGLVAPWIQGAYNSASFYRDVKDLVMDPYDDEIFYHELIEYFSKRMLKVARQLSEAGADIFCVGGNVASFSMVGPRYFEKYVLPYEIELFKKLRTLGVFSLYHNCGDASGLLPLYNDIGMDIYESMTAPPFGDTSLEYALETIDKKITLSGNIDQIKFLKEATPAQVYDAVRELACKVKSRGNFILGTSDYFSEGTPEANIHAFAQSAHEHGLY